VTDNAQSIHVTSHNQSGGITAGTVNLGAPPEMRHEVLSINARDGDRYACQVRLTPAGAQVNTGLRVEVLDSSPIDLELTPENAPIVMVAEAVREGPEGPGHKVTEMAPPLAPTYVATVRADEPIGNADLKWAFV
jgi:hypothetical protein